MVIYQGPLVQARMTLGVTGFWNSTIYPNIYYLTKNPDSYDATRAEIVGDIDGKLTVIKKLLLDCNFLIAI